jgi:ankyrin repeat protein
MQVEHADTESVEALLHAGAQPDAVREDNQACVHLAAMNGDAAIEILRMLLEGRGGADGANYNVQNAEEDTALHICRFHIDRAPLL